ncbi:helicase-associated domain-containing protein [Jatrophihabitans sp. YIM 134969]
MRRADSDTPSLREWLATRDDTALAALLRRRPDLALPAPGDLATLAARAVVRSSVQRAVDRLDAFALRLLGVVVTAHDDGDGTAAEIAARMPDVDPGVLRDRIADLMTLALVRDDPNTGDLLPVGPVAAALGGRRSGFGRGALHVFSNASDAQVSPVLRTLDLPDVRQPRAAQLIAGVLGDPDQLEAILEDAPPDARAVLQRLSSAPLATVAAGALRLHRGLDGLPGYDTDPDLAWLLEHGLLGPVDERTVELPHEVAVAIRTTPVPAAATPEPPPIVVAAPDRPVDLDDAGTTAVLEVLRWVDALATEWTTTPAPVLRSGGLGVRELRRTAKSLAISEADAALLVEVAATAGLVGPTTGIDPTFLPTSAFDTWTRRDPSVRWTELARAWLTMTRQPDLVGRRDGRDKVVTALGFDVERGTVPNLRADVLGVLATLPAGSAARSEDDVMARLAWNAPRQAGQAREAAAAILREAAVLGLTAAGGLTSYGRAALAASGLRADQTGTWGEVEARLDDALPEPVDTVLVQPDLTIVVPGQPVPELARELTLVADLESSGGAAVYRVSETSLRRAFDAGRSGADLLDFFTTTSVTPIPQALQYQIDDLGRRYGALRAGAATAYLRCDDEELLSRVLGDPATAPLGLRRLAPTVAICNVSPAKLLEALRQGGFAPAAESPAGTVLSLDDEPPRAPARRAARPVRSSTLGDGQLADIVRRMRTGEELASLRAVHEATVPSVPGVTSAAMLETIRTAIQTSSELWLGYVDDNGATMARTISPISMAGGQVRGYGAQDQLEVYQLHRIVTARLLESGD